MKTLPANPVVEYPDYYISIAEMIRANEERSIERQKIQAMACGRRYGKTDQTEALMYAALHVGPLANDEPTASTEGYARQPIPEPEPAQAVQPWRDDFISKAVSVYADWLHEARRNYRMQMAGRIPDETRECELAKKVNDNDEAVSDWDDEADDVLSKTRMDAAPSMSAKERELYEPIGRMRFGVSNEWESFLKEPYGSFLDEQREIELAERRAVANISAETLAQWKSPTYTTSGPLTFELVKKMAEEAFERMDTPKHEASMAELAELKEKAAQRNAVKGPSGREYNFPFLRGIDHGQNYAIGPTPLTRAGIEAMAKNIAEHPQPVAQREYIFPIRAQIEHGQHDANVCSTDGRVCTYCAALEPVSQLILDNDATGLRKHMAEQAALFSEGQLRSEPAKEPEEKDDLAAIRAYNHKIMLGG